MFVSQEWIYAQVASKSGLEHLSNDVVEPTGVDIQVEPEVEPEQNLDPVQETFEPIVEIHDDLDTPPPIVQETASNGLLQTVAIEPRLGQQILCGGIDTKLCLFSINKAVKKRENAKLIAKVREYSGH